MIEVIKFIGMIDEILLGLLLMLGMVYLLYILIVILIGGRK